LKPTKHQYVAFTVLVNHRNLLKESANTYPTNVAGIEANVDGGYNWHYYHSLTSKVSCFGLFDQWIKYY
jgi:hypothetical protein